MKIVAAFVPLLVGIVAVAAEDFCDPKLCRAGVKHVACDNNGDWAKDCPADRKLIPISDELKEKIVAAHNKWRDMTAAGNSNGLPTASKMATIAWDDDLQMTAELNVKKCYLSHDACMNTHKYNYVGQNLGISFASDHFQDPNPTALNSVDSWYKNEVKNATYDYIEKCCFSPLGNPGHFSMVVTDRATRVGCAISQYTSAEFGGYKATQLACNYNSINMDSSPVYRIGAPASKCASTNPEYPNLCGPNDPIDPNDFS